MRRAEAGSMPDELIESFLVHVRFSWNENSKRPAIDGSRRRCKSEKDRLGTCGNEVIKVVVDVYDTVGVMDPSTEGLRVCKFGVSGKLWALCCALAVTFTSSLANMRVAVGLRKDGAGNVCVSGSSCGGVGDGEVARG